MVADIPHMVADGCLHICISQYIPLSSIIHHYLIAVDPRSIPHWNNICCWWKSTVNPLCTAGYIQLYPIFWRWYHLVFPHTSHEFLPPNKSPKTSRVWCLSPSARTFTHYFCVLTPRGAWNAPTAPRNPWAMAALDTSTACGIGWAARSGMNKYFSTGFFDGWRMILQASGRGWTTSISHTTECVTGHPSLKRAKLRWVLGHGSIIWRTTKREWLYWNSKFSEDSFYFPSINYINTHLSDALNGTYSWHISDISCVRSSF